MLSLTAGDILSVQGRYTTNGLAGVETSHDPHRFGCKGRDTPVPHAPFLAAEMNRHKDEVDRWNISC